MSPGKTRACSTPGRLSDSLFWYQKLLRGHYPDEEKEAVERLDFPINEFQDMKMRPSLERALRHKEVLRA
jgi:hypothetical protein